LPDQVVEKEKYINGMHKNSTKIYLLQAESLKKQINLF
jgi:hypothetical protein